MKKQLSTLVTALTVLLLIGGITTASAQKVIRAGIGLTADHPLHEGLLKFKELVEERSDGGITVEAYHSGQLGDDRTMMEGLQFGTLQVTIPSTAPMANFIPQYSVFDLPFLFVNECVADKVLDGEVGQKLLDMLPNQNMVGLAYWENGFRQLTNNRRPVEEVADLQGLKVRTMENTLHMDAWRALGANPTPMSFSELFTALQQGIVDGQENPYPTIYLQRYYEVQDYLTDSRHIYSPFVFLVSKPFWDGLTEEEQKIVKDAAMEARLYQRERLREASKEYQQKLIEEGKMQYTEPTPEEREAMRKEVQPVIEKHSKVIGEDLVKETYAAVEAAEKECGIQ
jgi:tripartite ATP-independent transporter DctP family solute receptor